MRPLSLLLLLAVAITGCDSTNDTPTPDPNRARQFTVTIANVSTPGTVATDRAMGTVPLSPPAWAVFTGDDPMFTPGGTANEGTERIAEDGFPMAMVALLMGTSRVTAHGAAESPGGADMGPALFAALGGFPAESVSFSFSATPGQRFQFETMFVQSNDWFYAFRDGGLALFNGTTPVGTGAPLDVTDRLLVYDAGTEEDTAPGTGPDQKPVQEPMATNVGPADDNTAIRPASDDGFPIPANSQVIRVTIQTTADL